eukprot:NODE_2_length_91304_cov_0.692462.p36 type:complete len:271 gc:universal NODE_2_length_91304_cov_0.692462:24691-23879(-)
MIFIIASVLTLLLYSYTFKVLEQHRSKHPESDSPIRFMYGTLSCTLVANFLWSLWCDEFVDEYIFCFLFLFFAVICSFVAIYRAHEVFSDAYKHVGNEVTAKNLLWGYVPFTICPAMLFAFFGPEAFVFVVIGFYLWNFISESILEILFYTKLRNIKYAIGSDIEASMEALKALKKLFLIKLSIVILTGVAITGFVLLIIALINALISESSSVYYSMMYEIGFSMSTLSLYFLVPMTGILLRQRLLLSSIIPKISMGVSPTSSPDLVQEV